MVLGGNIYGLLNDTPAQIGQSSTWASLSLGGVATYATQTDGTLWTWEHYDDGPFVKDDDMPVLLSSGWSSVTGALYGSHVCGMKSGALSCWGSIAEGMLGDDAAWSDVPTAVSLP